MSFNVAPSGQLATEAVDVELHVASLAAGSKEMAADDTELLARLDSADAVASGMEAKLDEILDTLDDLLTGLEPKNAHKPQEITVPSPETQSDCSASEA